MNNEMGYNKIQSNDEGVSFWNNAIVHWVSIATVFINIGVIILFFLYIKPTDIPLKLQYNVFFGTSVQSHWWQVYFLPMMSIAFFLIDLVVGYILYKAKERVAAYVVVLGALFAAVALFIAAIGIVFNNQVV